MKLDFNSNNIRKNNVELLDCQIDLILRSLEFYSYTYQFIYPRNGKSITKEENLNDISLPITMIKNEVIGKKVEEAAPLIKEENYQTELDLSVKEIPEEEYIPESKQETIINPELKKLVLFCTHFLKYGI